MSISYKLNKDKNGVEIKFTEKPSEKVRAKLKELGFRWSNYSGVWYAKQSEETIAFAKELASEEGEQMSLNIPTEEPREEPKKELKVAERKETKKVADKHKNVSKTEKSASQKAYEEYKKAKAEKLAKEEKAEKPKDEPKKDNIVIFPKKRPEVKVAITPGVYTYEDCKQKLEEERKIFCDSDSQYVIDGLLAMCEINPNFRNNVMREDKSYSGAFKHFMEMARNGYALEYNGVTYLDNDTALGFAMDYFNEASVPTNVINGNIKAE